MALMDSSPGGGNDWSLKSFVARARELGMTPGKADPLEEASRNADELEAVAAAQEERRMAQGSAVKVMGYKPIEVIRSSPDRNHVTMVNVSDIKTAHGFEVKAAPTESTLELRPSPDGSEQLVKIKNRIFDREIIRDETGRVTELEDEIKLPKSNIRLEVSIQDNSKVVKIIENGEEARELKFSVMGGDDNSRIERPSFSAPSISGDSLMEEVFFHKKSLSPYQQPLIDEGEQVKPYELKTNEYTLSVDRGIITIRDNKDGLVFLQDGEGQNYIFHPESVSDTSLVKSRAKLDAVTPAAFREVLEARENQILDMLALFEKQGNPSEMRVRFSQSNSQGETEILVNRAEIKAELESISSQILELSNQASIFLTSQQQDLGNDPSKLSMLQGFLGFGGYNAEADPATVSKADNLNILNPKQTVAMFAGADGQYQYFNAEGRSLFGVV